MNILAQNFAALLNRKDLRYSVQEREKDVVINFSVNMENTALRSLITFDNDSKRVYFRINDIATIPSEKYGKGLMTCNHCNNLYRWAKFVVNLQDKVDATWECYSPADSSDPENIFWVLIRMLSAVDEAYLEFKKALTD